MQSRRSLTFPLGPWKGPQTTEHVRIPVGQGIWGAAAASGVTEVVDDVNAGDRYLACFASTTTRGWASPSSRRASSSSAPGAVRREPDRRRAAVTLR